jgi:hypothetical protein
MMANLKATKNIKISLYNVNAKNNEHISWKGLPSFTWYLMMKKCFNHDLHVFHKDLEMLFIFSISVVAFSALDYMMIHNDCKIFFPCFKVIPCINGCMHIKVD